MVFAVSFGVVEEAFESADCKSRQQQQQYEALKAPAPNVKERPCRTLLPRSGFSVALNTLV